MEQRWATTGSQFCLSPLRSFPVPGTEPTPKTSKPRFFLFLAVSQPRLSQLWPRPTSGTYSDWQDSSLSLLFFPTFGLIEGWVKQWLASLRALRCSNLSGRGRRWSIWDHSHAFYCTSNPVQYDSEFCLLHCVASLAHVVCFSLSRSYKNLVDRNSIEPGKVSLDLVW